MPYLQDLPFELIVRIAESLCLHCTDPPSASTSIRCLGYSPYCGCDTPSECPVSRTQEGSRTLGALCLTSHRLRDAAIRPLYHRPNPHKWWLLAGTMLARPDLARHIKELYIPVGLGTPESESVIPPAVLSYFKTRVDAYNASLPEHRRNDLLCSSEGSTLTSDRDENGTPILISLCPAAESIKAVIGWQYIFPAYPPMPMPSLHTIELAHWDTENGICLRHMAPLLRAAPNLRVLRFFSLTDDSDDEGAEMLGVTLEKVTEIELETSSINAETLEAVLKACPGLETFKYGAGGPLVGDEQFDPAQARDLMLQYGKNLKKVVIDLSEATGNAMLDEWDEDENEEVVKAFMEMETECELITDY
ncbi:F-box domain-containing protein [Madurella fahalii]|uniref:F-box domain-containing protein n=1 Tax=Madurella fahalii TaxID=1157608 RepID=A0ABQ0G621_9PEZI